MFCSRKPINTRKNSIIEIAIFLLSELRIGLASPPPLLFIGLKKSHSMQRLQTNSALSNFHLHFSPLWCVTHFHILLNVIELYELPWEICTGLIFALILRFTYIVQISFLIRAINEPIRGFRFAEDGCHREREGMKEREIEAEGERNI